MIASLSKKMQAVTFEELTTKLEALKKLYASPPLSRPLVTTTVGTTTSSFDSKYCLSFPLLHIVPSLDDDNESLKVSQCTSVRTTMQEQSTEALLEKWRRNM